MKSVIKGAGGISFILIMPSYLLCVWQYENGHKLLALIYCPINNYSSLHIDHIFPLSFYLSLSGDISVNLESEQFIYKKLKASFKKYALSSTLCLASISAHKKGFIVLVTSVRLLTILSETYQLGNRKCSVPIQNFKLSLV